MTARTLLVALLLRLFIAPCAVEAQQPTKVSRIGILAGSAQALRERCGHAALPQGLRELGYREGQNVRLEYRYTEGNVALLPALAADLVRPSVSYGKATPYFLVLDLLKRYVHVQNLRSASHPLQSRQCPL